MNIHVVRTALVLCSIAWIAIVVISAIDGLDIDLGDYRCFYAGARAIVENEDIYLVYSGGYIYPPLLAWLLAPVTFLGEGWSGFVFTVVMGGLGPVAAWLCAAAVRDAMGAKWTALQTWTVASAGMLVVIEKFQRVFQQGNSDVLIALGFAAAIRWHATRPIVAGLVMGFALNIKYLPIVLLPYFLIRGRWAMLAGVAGGTVLFALLPATTLGWSLNLEYLQRGFLGVAEASAGASSDAVANVQPLTWNRARGVPSALARAVGDEGVAWMITIAIAAVVFASGWALYVKHKTRLMLPRLGEQASSARGRVLTLLELCGLVVAVFVFGPQTEGRHLSITLPFTVVAAGLAFGHPSRVQRRLILGALVVYFLGLVLPPGGVVEGLVQAWRDVAGSVALLLAAYFVTLNAGLSWPREDGEPRLERETAPHAA